MELIEHMMDLYTEVVDILVLDKEFVALAFAVVAFVAFVVEELQVDKQNLDTSLKEEPLGQT